VPQKYLIFSSLAHPRLISKGRHEQFSPCRQRTCFSIINIRSGGSGLIRENASTDLAENALNQNAFALRLF
jgi:hypothetical protein